MINELYDRVETESALNALTKLSLSLPEPFLLIGGWGVYVTVNESFSGKHNTNYLGSRDIDVCFHMNRDIELETSIFSKAVDTITSMGYIPHSNGRFYKIISKESGSVLTEVEAKKYRIYDLYYLYIDVMVDYIHPLHETVFGSSVIDEPLFERVFMENTGVTTRYFNLDIVTPPAYILLASKLKALPNRTKDDKQIKDACDIFAILWHSRVRYSEIMSDVKREYPVEVDSGVNAITRDIARRAAMHLGVEVDEYNGVVNGLM